MRILCERRRGRVASCLSSFSVIKLSGLARAFVDTPSWYRESSSRLHPDMVILRKEAFEPLATLHSQVRANPRPNMGGFYGERKLLAKTISKKHFHNLVAVRPGPKRRLTLSCPPSPYQPPTCFSIFHELTLLMPYSTYPIHLCLGFLGKIC